MVTEKTEAEGRSFVGVKRHFLFAETSDFISLGYNITYKWTAHIGQEKAMPVCLSHV